MHNSALTNIILTLIAFATIWFLISYVIYRIRRNDEPDDDSGVINRNELHYIAKFNRTIRAMIISFMYDGYALHTHLKCDGVPIANLVRTNFTYDDFDIEVKWIKQPVVNDLLRRKMIRPSQIDGLDTATATIVYKLRPMAVVWCVFTLLRYRSIMKTVTDLQYLKI